MLGKCGDRVALLLRWCEIGVDVVGEESRGAESGYPALGNHHGRVARDIAGKALLASLDHKCAEAAQLDVLAVGESLLDVCHEFLHNEYHGTLLHTGLTRNLVDNICFIHCTSLQMLVFAPQRFSLAD